MRSLPSCMNSSSADDGSAQLDEERVSTAGGLTSRVTSLEIECGHSKQVLQQVQRDVAALNEELAQLKRKVATQKSKYEKIRLLLSDDLSAKKEVKALEKVLMEIFDMTFFYKKFLWGKDDDDDHRKGINLSSHSDLVPLQKLISGSLSSAKLTNKDVSAAFKTLFGRKRVAKCMARKAQKNKKENHNVDNRRSRLDIHTIKLIFNSCFDFQQNRRISAQQRCERFETKNVCRREEAGIIR